LFFRQSEKQLPSSQVATVATWIDSLAMVAKKLSFSLRWQSLPAQSLFVNGLDGGSHRR
jgi:hypothetical protein